MNVPTVHGLPSGGSREDTVRLRARASCSGQSGRTTLDRFVSHSSLFFAMTERREWAVDLAWAGQGRAGQGWVRGFSPG